MTIYVRKGGKIEWKFYRKSYRKARWRRLGQRLLNDFMATNPEATGIIFVKWK